MSEPRKSSKRSAPPADVVVVGSYNQDMVWQGARFPQPGETRMGRFSSGPGGKGFNQAIAAARQGARTAFVAAIGRDALGATAEQLAKSENIDARWQKVAAEATGTAAIWLNAQGQNMIIVAPGANALLSPAHVIAQAPTLQAAKVLVTQHEVHPVATQRALEVAAAAGVLRIHNPAPALDNGHAAALLPLADVITPNEAEFAALLRGRGHSIGVEGVAAADAPSLHALCRVLGVPTVVITLGSEGVFVSHADAALRQDNAPFYRIAAEQVNVVDTTGAGDAFNGALAASYAQAPEATFETHVRHAVRSAACAIEANGAALAMPTREQVQRRFEH